MPAGTFVIGHLVKGIFDLWSSASLSSSAGIRVGVTLLNFFNLNLIETLASNWHALIKLVLDNLKQSVPHERWTL